MFNFFLKKMRQNINNLMIWIMEDVTETLISDLVRPSTRG